MGDGRLVSQRQVQTEIGLKQVLAANESGVGVINLAIDKKFQREVRRELSDALALCIGLLVSATTVEADAQ